MKVATINKILTTGLFLLAMGQTENAFAKYIIGTLGSGASAIDYVQVNCWDNGAGAPQRLEIQVLDLTAGATPRVSVQVQKDLLATNATDETDNDINWSPIATVYGGAGLYNVFINKSASGAQSYGIQVYCKTSSGALTGASGKMQLQNQ